MDASDTPQSLRALFDAAEAKRQIVESSYDSSSPTYASELEAAISLYTKTHEAIATSSLFSPNEGIEDVATSELPFLLTSFYIAELVQKTPRLQPQERIPVLRRARLAYDAFLNLVDAYGLVKSPYNRLLERYQDDRDAFALVPSTADAAAKRNGKIASFKAEKALKEKLSILKANPRYLENGDEELVRELYLTNTLFCIHTTFTSLDYLNRELSLLSRAPPAPPRSHANGSKQAAAGGGPYPAPRPAHEPAPRQRRPAPVQGGQAPPALHATGVRVEAGAAARGVPSRAQPADHVDRRVSGGGAAAGQHSRRRHAAQDGGGRRRYGCGGSGDVQGQGLG
ncbi:hypothetical protein V2G26_006730 [Clonostachys chloroleuca]